VTEFAAADSFRRNWSKNGVVDETAAMGNNAGTQTSRIAMAAGKIGLPKMMPPTF